MNKLLIITTCIVCVFELCLSEDKDNEDILHESINDQPQARVKEAKDALSTEKTNLNSLMKELEIFKGEVEIRLAIVLINEKNDVIKHKNLTLQNVQDYIRKTKNEGKIADFCYETAKEEVSALEKNISHEVQQCEVATFSIMEPHFDLIYTMIEDCKNLLKEIKMIEVNCVAKHGFLGDEFTDCLEAKTSPISTAFYMLNMATREMKYNKNPYSNEIHRCYFQLQNKVLEEFSSIFKKATRCIDEVETEPEKHTEL